MKSIKIVSMDGVSCSFLESVLDVCTFEWLITHDVADYGRKELEFYLHNENGFAVVFPTSNPNIFEPYNYYYLNGKHYGTESEYLNALHEKKFNKKIKDIIDE